MKSVRKLLDYSEKALGAICVMSFIAMFVLGVMTVVFRFVIQSSLAFPDELIRYLFVWVIALGAAIAMRRNLHASIGMFVEKLPDGLKRATLLFASTCTAIFLAIVVYYGTLLTIRVTPQISPALEVSMAWVYSALPVGAGFTLIFTIELLFTQASQPASDLA